MKKIAIMTTACLMFSAVGSAASEKTITRGQSYGCTSKAYYEKIIGFVVDQDKAAFEKELTRGIATGLCTVFSVGDSVFLTDTGMLSGVVKIRRKGETLEYWTSMEAIQ